MYLAQNFLRDCLKRSGEQAIKQPFFFIDFGINYTTDETCVPIEICIQPFTLDPNSAPVKPFLQIINEVVPNQYLLRAKQHADFEHGITPENNPSHPTDFLLLWNTINNFIWTFTKKCGETFVPIVICLSFRRGVQCIENLATKAGLYDKIGESGFMHALPFEAFVKFFYESQGKVVPISAIPKCLCPLLSYIPETKYKCSFHSNIKTRSFCCCQSNVAYLVGELTCNFNPYNQFNILHSTSNE
ncbi:hypothetical protein EHI8A_068760 [Entamoeba histolytica HM-1:IMSS-B]|uniref:Maelstrom domain-containing protein n=8 Tax=Entamoeba TaxID=5758 RepID=C4LSX8_ENTH1|nr:hypothetical protein ENU1_096000 [Entamoeba nuttalli P19]XP_657534.1 hypothetical protein EHI_148080 [Entamoeba histolytica HM-1:IMSS]EMD49809.1 Hypothetical protein EHI5A_101520 [Entamoeba histolytica KU27]EMH72856.1 hypothetical protein EHI8A_068760 [Entamoeba histolytica HM-1:IMSS-B]EMS17489.1 hypothetical protein KM1_125060 [Entamoeba histolytica HM-3:IMSS]ENY60168.1 hypothetical protein EHI7A_066260 [Entamoeba histolytica HM-1:IMSS-A]GAT91646.1 hypothetical protein CL6EHI_148080 [Enta|eukprot:XP_008857392.1 hypothetical protein ENU1_096000 [Entamoeba nuttalli P19]